MNKIPKGIIPAPDLPDEDRFDDAPDSLLVVNKGSGGEFYEFVMNANRIIIEEIGSIFPKNTPVANIVYWVGGGQFVEDSTIVYTEDETILFATLPSRIMSEVEMIEGDPDLMADILEKREERKRENG